MGTCKIEEDREIMIYRIIRCKCIVFIFITLMDSVSLDSMIEYKLSRSITHSTIVIAQLLL